LFSLQQQENAMNSNPATRLGGDGLRGRDKQQGALRDEDTGQDVVRNDRGEDQPKDKERAQQHPGLREQKDAALNRPQSPGEPAGGE
jgi:hypothetical protein